MIHVTKEQCRYIMVLVEYSDSIHHLKIVSVQKGIVISKYMLPPTGTFHLPQQLAQHAQV